MLFVILSPSGPYFRGGFKPIALAAVHESVRSWPGGTGGHKLGVNYSPGFLPLRIAAKAGYDQILWLLGEDRKVTEAGAMNFFVVVKREDEESGLDVLTPPLDGTILPGLTRASCLSLLQGHTAQQMVLPEISASLHLHTHERNVTMADLVEWSRQGRLLEAFGAGTAVIVAPVGRIGFEGKDLVLPKYETGLGPVGHALWKRLVEIQEGRVQWDDWSVPCE